MPPIGNKMNCWSNMTITNKILLNMKIYQTSIIWILSLIVLVFSGGCNSGLERNQTNIINDDIEGRWVGISKELGPISHIFKIYMKRK